MAKKIVNGKEYEMIKIRIFEDDKSNGRIEEIGLRGDWTNDKLSIKLDNKFGEDRWCFE